MVDDALPTVNVPIREVPDELVAMVTSISVLPEPAKCVGVIHGLSGMTTQLQPVAVETCSVIAEPPELTTGVEFDKRNVHGPTVSGNDVLTPSNVTSSQSTPVPVAEICPPTPAVSTFVVPERTL